MKTVFCITGGYYYNWAGGRSFYDWLYNFVENNNDFDAVIMSWQPKENVPRDLIDKFKFIFRSNNGCDWGCYDDFLKAYKNNGWTYDYTIFCHDDITSEQYDWPSRMIQHIESNHEFELTSLVGRYMNVPSEISKKRNPEFVKEFLSMCFCMRMTDYLLKNNPFVTIPGHDQDMVGDTGCNVVTANIWNMWGSDKIGWACSDGECADASLATAVGHYKRGRVARTFPFPSKDAKRNTPSLKQAADQGWIIKPDEFAKNEKLKYK